MGHHKYTVGYKDDFRHRCEICTYANDAYEARLIAIETDKYVKDHPHLIDYVMPV